MNGQNQPTLLERIRNRDHKLMSAMSYIVPICILLSYPIISIVFGSSRSILDDDSCNAGAYWLFVMGLMLLFQRILFVLAAAYTAYKEA